MSKKFKQIAELVQKHIKVPGKSAKVANRTADKVPGFARGQQHAHSQTTAGVGHYGSPKPLGQPHHVMPSGLWDSPKKKMYEDGVAMPGGAAPMTTASVPTTQDPNVGAAFRKLRMQKNQTSFLRRKKPMMESFLMYLEDLNESTMESSFGEKKGPRHVKNYILPYLSKKGRAKTVAAFANTEAPLDKVDHENHGELYDPNAEYTHILEKPHQGYAAGTKIKITHVDHEDGKIYAHTEKHGRIPLSKIGKPEAIKKPVRTKAGFDVEGVVAKNVGDNTPAGSSNVDRDFQVHYTGKVGKKALARGVVKTVGEKPEPQEALVRGESKLDRGKFGSTTLVWKPHPTKKGVGTWGFSGHKKMHEIFSTIKIKHRDENGNVIKDKNGNDVESPILDYLNKFHKDGIVKKGFSAKAPHGTTRQYLRGSNINVLHIHNKDNKHSTTYTVGNTSLRGRTNLGHLDDDALDRLDGSISFETGKRGTMKVSHVPKRGVMREFASASVDNPNEHKSLENKEHADEFVKRVQKHGEEYYGD